VVIFHSRKAAKRRVASLGKKAELIEVTQQKGLLDLKEILGQLGQLKVTSLMIEGGAQVATSALRAKAVQKINFFYGPQIIGSGGRPGIEDLGIDRLKQARRWGIHRIRHFPPDFMVEGYPEDAAG
jgi:diaminohydroxyphosphoribosylaminopyrimidine deaminase/5-amino-6-(5-phosphoribosylamino)uracil reductase